jgi:hypothetical protein
MFRISALPYASFASLFDSDEDALAARRAKRVTADRTPGFPCRVSLEDAAVGETLILTHYIHQDADSPFRASHAVYVREGAVEAAPEVGEVPALLRSRILSLRGFDTEGMMRAADMVDGRELEQALTAMLAGPEVGYVHIHYAKPGCYAARAARA